MTTTDLLAILLIGATTIAVVTTAGVRRLTRENDTQHAMLVAAVAEGRRRQARLLTALRDVAELRTQLRFLQIQRAPTAERPLVPPSPSPTPDRPPPRGHFPGPGSGATTRRDPGGTR